MLKYFLILTLFLPACSTVTYPISILPLWDELVTIEAPHGFEMFYDSWATHTARDYYISGTTMINGSYFGLIDSWVYYPAGLWRSGIVELSPAIYDDPNITHVVRISHTEPQSVRIFPNKHLLYMKWGSGDDAFQAGPLVLSGGIIQDFWDSWHAREAHERTLIGKTESGKIYFFLSRKQLSLTEIGEQIRIDPRFQHDPITVLNLDGWPSTAYFDGVRGFREDKKLPIFFRISP